MSPETYNALTPSERKEVDALWKQFIAAVKATRLDDGWEFARRYAIVEEGGSYVCSDGTVTLPGIRAKSRRSLEALIEDATMNYGR